jgi:hypothetical protein
MDLMALQLYRYGGYDGFCAPAYQYPGSQYVGGVEDSTGPNNARLSHSIQLMHGRQLGHRFLSHLLDVISINKNRDGNYAYGQYKYYEAKKEPCLISVTKGFSPADGGHVLIPYFAEDSAGVKKKIYVYDPNRSFYASGGDGHDFYSNRVNFIEINESNGQWKYLMDGESVPWTGYPGGGLSDAGNCIIIPFSVVRSLDRLPQSLFADAAEALAKIFVFGDTRLGEVSTPDGRVFRPDGSRVGEDTCLQLRSVMPFIPINGGHPVGSDSELWFVRGENDFQLDVCGGAGGYKVQLFSDDTAFTISSEEQGAGETILVRGFQTGRPTVEVRKADGTNGSGLICIENNRKAE